MILKRNFKKKEKKEILKLKTKKRCSKHKSKITRAPL
jgi:hypothetical protein